MLPILPGMIACNHQPTLILNTAPLEGANQCNDLPENGSANQNDLDPLASFHPNPANWKLAGRTSLKLPIFPGSWSNGHLLFGFLEKMAYVDTTGPKKLVALEGRKMWGTIGSSFELWLLGRKFAEAWWMLGLLCHRAKLVSLISRFQVGRLNL